MTRALRSHHVWQLRRLDLKVESVDVRCACGQYENVVGGRPLVFVHNVWILLSLVSYVFAVVLVVDMCAYDKTVCTMWW